MGSFHIMGALGLIAVLGAGYAVLSISARGLLPLLALNTLDLVKSWLSLGSGGERRKLETSAGLTIPYGIPIAMGTLLWWFGRGIRL